MRAIEVYNAERLLKNTCSHLIEVHLIMYEESSEYFQYMSGVDAEKIGFKKLIAIKEVTFYYC